MTDTAESMRRCALGAFLRHWRASQDMSVEAMAERAGMSHMTLRRAEDGHALRARSYHVLEQATGLPAGMVTRALTDDEALVDLAAKLGIEIDENQSPAAFLRSFAYPVAWSQQLTAPQPDDVQLATLLVSRLVARHNRSPVEVTALAAVLALVREWAGVPDGD